VVKIVTSNHPSLNVVGSNPDREFGFFHVRALSSYYGTSVVLLTCPLVPEIMHGKSPEVFLQQ
jgi:hypothetical protein